MGSIIQEMYWRVKCLSKPGRIFPFMVRRCLLILTWTLLFCTVLFLVNLSKENRSLHPEKLLTSFCRFADHKPSPLPATLQYSSIKKPRLFRSSLHLDHRLLTIKSCSLKLNCRLCQQPFKKPFVPPCIHNDIWRLLRENSLHCWISPKRFH